MVEGQGPCDNRARAMNRENGHLTFDFFITCLEKIKYLLTGIKIDKGLILMFSHVTALFDERM